VALVEDLDPVDGSVRHPAILSTLDRAVKQPGRRYGAGVHVRALAPGRVNLIGDHTDYLGGLALPMAIDLGTTVEGERGGARVRLTSADVAGTVDLSLDDPLGDAPVGSWARYVAGVVAEVSPTEGLVGRVRSTVPVGSGLSSSAALEVAVALALGAAGSPVDLALLCQRAEQRSSGVPSGVMDQLASAGGVAGHALLIDFADLSRTEPVPVPDSAEIVVVHSGQERTLAGSAYAERRAQAEEAERRLGRRYRNLDVDEIDVLDDALLARRARHVITENGRVLACAAAFRAADLPRAGRLMSESHASLRDDYEVSTPVLDELVERLVTTPGVHGARLTGAGFGGCVVALTDPGALAPASFGARQWTVRPSPGAHLVTT
jgi:galactokinase